MTIQWIDKIEWLDDVKDKMPMIIRVTENALHYYIDGKHKHVRTYIGFTHAERVEQAYKDAAHYEEKNGVKSLIITD